MLPRKFRVTGSGPRAGGTYRREFTGVDTTSSSGDLMLCLTVMYFLNSDMSQFGVLAFSNWNGVYIDLRHVFSLSTDSDPSAFVHRVMSFLSFYEHGQVKVAGAFPYLFMGLNLFTRT
ncbi:hypothetical protein RRG08_005700 [Elysia crispata]|uniref:Uncharacterized protein n=1 Tax=Elysia crispata TaxID=231223 RepID=A0AAE0YCK2_9GAST|nr:hypothetical protein RRG08_005700 [Elysia crispata]